ncbi:hypothetical protein HCX48_10905 [Rhodocyclus tenuis]|uniref:Uncharacterized protein n=1 Tax=Rhodocyclus gracilis TaxID=2929842 RepID=A0ABX0WJ27_9RHOO|nr:hypothetical protein [Rhodocyclus gracilis]NJA89726.1 hypothetical protein [Rhodocyclus gracilis]
MVSDLRDSIQRLLNARLNRILTAAAIGIPSRDQYQAFRTFALDEFGNGGFLPELDALLKQQERQGTGRPRQQERRCHDE